MKPPKNFYNAVDRRKLDISDNLLPDVTTSDAGKVLKVNSEGKYALLPDGGAYTMTVAITYDETTEEYRANKTHTEIVEAIEAGVIVKATYDGRTFVYAGTNDPSAFDGVYFTYIQADSEDQLLCKCFEIDSDNRIVYSSHDISEELPAVTSADYEKILQVDENGRWIATKDQFHVGDVWEIPHGHRYITAVTASYGLVGGFTIELPKYIANDVKWFEFLSGTSPEGENWNSSVFAVDENATPIVSNVSFTDLFEYYNAGSQMKNDWINLQGFKIKSAYRQTFENYIGKTIYFIINRTYIRFLAAKPTT